MKLCPSCRGPVIVVVGGRAWCVQPYREGGCAGFWVHRDGVWERQAWHKPLLMYERAT